MSNASSTTYANGLQQHNLTTAIDYINQNGSTTCGASFPNVPTPDNGIILEKPTNTGPYYAPVAANPTAYYSTQLVTQAPGTILITNNFGPEDPSTISGVNNSFNNSSIRIVTHNNNNNNSTNNNNNNNCKATTLDEDKQLYHQLHHLHHQPPPPAAVASSSTSTQSMNPVKTPNPLVSTPAPGTTTTTSTVVLDRINICINNHYGDTSTMSQQSPIIPPVIKHTTIVDAAASCTPPPSLQSVEARTGIMADVHVDEPDSTTSTNCHSEIVPMEQDLSSETAQEHESEKDTSYESVVVEQKFEIGEDVFVKRRDGRFYLGTVVNVHRQQYLVQFDDKTDYWSNVDELFKLSKIEKPSCLSCRQATEDDSIETCERCGRSYHQRCTEEVTPNTGEWMCKRCVKPMKYSFLEEAGDKTTLKRKASRDSKKVIKQFPYELGSLTWDDKHRVNLEQIYCYCGKSGQFDNNMIQCCKCKQWFHAHCVECVKTLFRGDVFFIFGCSVCNNGKEFLRRIEMNWVDLTHLILYNMAIMKNFQKYHHLHKDIYPFALEKRAALQLPTLILKLSDNEFKANLLKTLQTHPKLFQCGKEIKKDHAFWGLRSNKPPQGLFYDVKPHEVLSNHLIKDKLKINVLTCDDEEDNDDDSDNEDDDNTSRKCDKIEQPPAKKAKLVDKFDDDDKFTSDDEIPIKQILEKTKITNSSSDIRGIKPEDSDNSNELPTISEQQEKIQNKEDITTAVTGKSLTQQKSSRKRKAFTLSKGYKDSDKSNDLSRIVCDSSSDENSSSSRGTLDLIIPPPKDFLGLNNPFRMLTPKKNDNPTTSSSYKMTGSSCITKKTVSFSNSALDLNSKIAALRSTGLFPNISNSDIAKAAGQPRLVRTIKRRLSAKDIMIGPNQEVRRRRTRPLSSNIEVISTTTINPIVSAFFPIRASISSEAANSTTNNNKNATSASATSSSQSNSPHITSSASSSLDCVPGVPATTTHGRRLRKRPEKSSPQNSRRNSISSSSSSSNSSSAQLTLPPPTQPPNTVPMTDLKQSVNKYFGAVNRIENGEKFIIRAKRRLTNGQLQYLIEWES